MDGVYTAVEDFFSALAEDRLLDSPPPRVETSGSDICYTNPTVYCKDLMEGHREMVASMFLGLSNYARETVNVTMGYLLLLLLLSSHLSTPKSFTNPKTPIWIFSMSVICLMLQIVYKITGYPNKVYFMVMPCNVLWTLSTMLALPLPRDVRHGLIQLWYSFQILVWVVFASADTDDLKGPFEVEFFWINHVLLLIPPFYYLLVKKVSIKDASLAWLGASCAIMGIFYFTIVTPLAFYSKLNLNYMLSPPLVIDGDDYRLKSRVGIAIAFAIARGTMILIEYIFVRKLVKTEESDKKKKRY